MLAVGLGDDAAAQPAFDNGDADMLFKDITLCVRYSVVMVSMAVAMSASVQVRLRKTRVGDNAEQKEDGLHVKKTEQEKTQVKTVRLLSSRDSD